MTSFPWSAGYWRATTPDGRLQLARRRECRRKGSSFRKTGYSGTTSAFLNQTPTAPPERNKVNATIETQFLITDSSSRAVAKISCCVLRADVCVVRLVTFHRMSGRLLHSV